ncbi:MAG: hypothetical protein BZY88_03485 [SAR202 cluster bacterium Io17-Chloro-G9]|nr:MAG: hypothetical protein BZY88_03485 [SAR202 cluster bacterium Io17-Chloro-G9]
MIAALVLLYGLQVVMFGIHPRHWDHLFAAGYTTLLLGIWVSLSNRQRLENTITRLIGRAALTLPQGMTQESFSQRFEQRANSWSQWIAVAIALTLAVTYVKVYWPLGDPAKIAETVVGIVSAYIAGRILGRMVAYGSLGGFVHKEGIGVAPKPGHIDGACGLKPFGDFYFHQAMLAAVPVIFLGMWYLIIPVFPFNDYSNWRAAYGWLLPVALAIEILSFVLPMVSIHQDMKTEKARFLKEADTLSQEIVDVQAKLEKPWPPGERESLSAQVRGMTLRYHEIENMTSWPVDFRTRRRFTLSNLVLSVPFLSNYPALLDVWKIIYK